jgi:hypothetical protein
MAVLNEWAYYDEWEKRMDAATRDAVRDGCIRSADRVLPMIFDYLGTPDALLDVGAGEGHWSASAARLGVTVTHALDAESHHAYGVEVYEWTAGESLPLLGGSDTWPLALCLEMAEHVTEAEGGALVGELCRVAEQVVWSAAIPGQGGDGHLNEQWPAYWSQRFAEHGYYLDDPGWRLDLWSDPDVEPWYAQNLLLAFKPRLFAETRAAFPPPQPLVHPVTWAHHRGVPAP